MTSSGDSEIKNLRRRQNFGAFVVRIEPSVGNPQPNRSGEREQETGSGANRCVGSPGVRLTADLENLLPPCILLEYPAGIQMRPAVGKAA